MNGGACFNYILNYKCFCTLFYTGKNCEQSKFLIILRKNFLNIISLVIQVNKQYKQVIIISIIISLMILCTLLIRVCRIYKSKRLE